MKKLLFGLIATVMLGFTGNAQEYKNSKNQFDSRGEIHNQVMIDFTRKNLPNDLPLSSVVLEVRKVIESNPSYINAIGRENLNFDYKILEDALGDYSNNYRTLINNTSLSSNSKQIAQEIVNLTFSENISYTSFISSIKQKENSIMASSISANEKEILLTATSVARHSAYLWIVNLKVEGNSDQPQAKKKGRGWIIAGADFLGACIGGLAGAYYGSGAAYYITAGFQ